MSGGYFVACVPCDLHEELPCVFARREAEALAAASDALARLASARAAVGSLRVVLGDLDLDLKFFVEHRGHPVVALDADEVATLKPLEKAAKFAGTESRRVDAEYKARQRVEAERRGREEAERFNRRNGVGVAVRFWPGVREGDGRLSRTRSEAWSLPSGDAVVLVEGYPGGVALTHVEPAPDSASTAQVGVTDSARKTPRGVRDGEIVLGGGDAPVRGVEVRLQRVRRRARRVHRVRVGRLLRGRARPGRGGAAARGACLDEGRRVQEDAGVREASMGCTRSWVVR